MTVMIPHGCYTGQCWVAPYMRNVKEDNDMSATEHELQETEGA